MLKLFNLFVICFICLKNYSQNKQINFYSKTIANNKIVNSLEYTFEKKGNIYSIVYPPSSLSVIKNDSSKEYYKDTSRYGPYKFTRKKNLIKFSYLQDNRWVINDLYLLQLDTVFLIPNIYSSSPDSYSTKCTLVDSCFPITIKNKKYYFYKFKQFTNYDYSTLQEIVYINKKNFLPYKIEYYADKGFKTLCKTIESENYK